jgi:hypothetical protein
MTVTPASLSDAALVIARSADQQQHPLVQRQEISGQADRRI